MVQQCVIALSTIFQLPREGCSDRRTSRTQSVWLSPVFRRTLLAVDGPLSAPRASIRTQEPIECSVTPEQLKQSLACDIWIVWKESSQCQPLV